MSNNFINQISNSNQSDRWQGLGVFFDSKFYFHNHVDFVFSEYIKLLGLIRSITFRSSSLECLCVLYVTLAMSKLEYASAAWNSITSTDVNKLERIRQKFASVCFYRFFLRVPYSYTFALEKLILHSLRKRRHHLDALFSFASIVTLILHFSWKMLVFVFLLATFGTSQRLVFVRLTNTVLLLGAPMLPTRWVKISKYLRSERFLSIIFYNLVPEIVHTILGSCS
jgi:hypothetical protein